MDAQDLSEKNKKTALRVMIAVCAMVGLSFASVPLYNIFCRVTGLSGTTQISQAFPKAEDILDREIMVRFDANTARDLPWNFRPERLSMTLNVGERGFASYVALNRSRVPIAGTATFNVTPLKAGKYFQKVQCFCFNEQILQPNEKVNMPVLFYVDPAIAEDRNMDDVKVITLSYSFFKTDSQALDDALEQFYEQGEE